MELELDPAHHRTGDVWHVLLPAAAAGPPLRYSFQFRSGVGSEASISAGWAPDPLAPLLCPLSRMSLWGEDRRAPGGPGGTYAFEDLAVCSLDCRGRGLAFPGAEAGAWAGVLTLGRQGVPSRTPAGAAATEWSP